MKDFNAEDLGSPLWGMAATGWVLPEASGVAHTLWARTKASRVLPEVFDSLYAAATTNVQALSGSQLRIGRVAQLLESAIVGGAPPRHAELVPLLCPPPIVQVTRLLTVMGASVTGSDPRRDFHTTALQEAASEDPFYLRWESSSDGTQTD